MTIKELLDKIEDVKISADICIRDHRGEVWTINSIEINPEFVILSTEPHVN